jgi:hypothetical protein
VSRQVETLKLRPYVPAGGDVKAEVLCPAGGDVNAEVLCPGRWRL